MIHSLFITIYLTSQQSASTFYTRSTGSSTTAIRSSDLVTHVLISLARRTSYIRPSSPLTGHVARLPEDTRSPAQHTKPCDTCHMQVCHSIAFYTLVGGDVQAALGKGGLTNFAGTTQHTAVLPVHLLPDA